MIHYYTYVLNTEFFYMLTHSYLVFVDVYAFICTDFY